MKTALEQIDISTKQSLESEWAHSGKTKPQIFLGISFENFLILKVQQINSAWVEDRKNLIDSMKRMEREIQDLAAMAQKWKEYAEAKQLVIEYYEKKEKEENENI